MREKYIQASGLALTIIGLVFIGFVYATQPRTIAEVGTKSQVALGTYEVDRSALSAGIESFRREDFEGARVSFARADPERRDSETQFYIAYSFYRQGWGRWSNDDGLFTKGLETVNIVTSLDPQFVTKDASLKMRTPGELRTELEDGLRLTPADFNPLRLTRERK